MNNIEILFTLASIHFITALTPGPNFVIIGRYASTFSRKFGFMAALGVLAGTLSWICLTMLGLGAIISTHPLAYRIIQYSGSAYLIWLGIKMLVTGIRNRYRKEEQKVQMVTSTRSVFFSGYFANITNPKSIVYYTSLFSALIPMDASRELFFGASVTAFLVSVMWWFFVATFMSLPKTSDLLISFRRQIDFITGGALVLLGIRLSVDR